ncbi:ABC transporter permease [candidate division CSSED10-310 bacterium]|uniref:Transport permease protein n=1 Tax=candidate division CSSED10-310 bacterium TaxID=2855610 RepID=A0ABV6YTP2_UNCC1
MFWRFVSFLRKDLYIELSYKFSFVFQFAGIFFQITLFYFMAKFVGQGADRFLVNYGGSYFAFVLIGIAYQSYFNLALGSFSQNLRRDQMLGTLEMMLMTPTSGQQVVVLSASYDMLFTSFRIIIYIGVGALFFGLDLQHINILSCITILILSILSFSGLGILSAAIIMYVKRGDPVVWLFSTLNTLFGGVYFTTDVLPPLLKKLSLLLPMTHTLHAFRQALLFGAGIEDIITEIMILLVFSIITLPAGLLAFKLAIQQAKRHGSLGQY